LFINIFILTVIVSWRQLAIIKGRELIANFLNYIMQVSSAPSPLQPTNTSSKPGKLIGVLVAIFVILIIVAIVLVLAQNGASSKPATTTVNNPTPLTDAQKAEVLNSLKAQTSATPAMTDASKAQVLDELKKESAKTPAMTDAEKAEILNSLKGQ